MGGSVSIVHTTSFKVPQKSSFMKSTTFFFLPHSLPRSYWGLICQARGPWWMPSLLAEPQFSQVYDTYEALPGKHPGFLTLKGVDPMKTVHRLLLHQPPPMSEPGDPTGFSGYRFATTRKGRNWSAICHPVINLMLIWLQLMQRRLCYPSSKPVSQHPKQVHAVTKGTGTYLWAKWSWPRKLKKLINEEVTWSIINRQ